VGSQKAELWIVGGGPEERRLRDLANKINKEKKIRFFGFMDYSYLPSIYKRADIFVHPAKWPEPFNRTAPEAMLARLPVVASDSGALPEILGDSGLIFRTGNVSEPQEIARNTYRKQEFEGKPRSEGLQQMHERLFTRFNYQAHLKEYKNLVN